MITQYCFNVGNFGFLTFIDDNREYQHNNHGTVDYYWNISDSVECPIRDLVYL